MRWTVSRGASVYCQEINKFFVIKFWWWWYTIFLNKWYTLVSCFLQTTIKNRQDSSKAFGEQWRHRRSSWITRGFPCSLCVNKSIRHHSSMILLRLLRSYAQWSYKWKLNDHFKMIFCSWRNSKALRRNLAMTVIQVTLDGLNFDLSKFLISRCEVTVPIFFSI